MTHRPAPRAFSLLEAVITMTLVSILSAAAVISYQWVIDRAHNSAATQALSAFSLASSAYYSLHSSWPQFANLNDVESAYGYVTGTTASTASEQISVGYDTTNNVLDLAAYDASTSTCFFLTVLPPNSTTPPLKISSTSLSCTGTTILTSALTSSSGASW